jgi:hypothetical protein
MGDATKLAKAQLIELDAQFKDPASGGQTVVVQFNPESLKVSMTNQTQQQQSAGDQRGNSPRQIVGAGASKLTLQLWFDVTAPGGSSARDVRELTSQVSYFMKPKSPSSGGGGTSNQPVPPGVRFQWGTFRFDGLMDSLDETLDFFSPEGRPLRSNMGLSISGQVEIVPPAGGGADPAAAAGPTAGVRPLTQIAAGVTLPGLAASAGLGGNWQAIASANGIENARLLTPGSLVDLNVPAGPNAPGIGVSAAVSSGVSG